MLCVLRCRASRSPTRPSVRSLVCPLACVACVSWEQVAGELRGSINVGRLDVTAQPSTAQRCQAACTQQHRRRAAREDVTHVRPLPSLTTSVACRVCAAVNVSGLPHILYLSRGRLFEYAGSREAHDLTRFAHDKLHRRTQQQAEGEDGGRAVPAPPTALSALSAMALRWSDQLLYAVTATPAVAAALLSLGAVLGALLTLLAFALLLPNNERTAQTATERSGKSAVPVERAAKMRKAD